MQSAREMFAEFESHPNFHVGFILQTRINFFKLKQKDVAAQAEIMQATLSNILNGRAIPKRETIDAIEKAITTLSRRH